MIKKYGQPDEVMNMRLIWHDNGPWQITEIMNKEIDHNFPIPHKDAMHTDTHQRTLHQRLPAATMCLGVTP